MESPNQPPPPQAISTIHKHTVQSRKKTLPSKSVAPIWIFSCTAESCIPNGEFTKQHVTENTYSQLRNNGIMYFFLNFR